MVNKKGYIRTLEAIIAIVLIFAVIITILPKKEITNKTPDDIDSTASGILNEIQNNNELRDYVINMAITDGTDSRDPTKNVYDEIVKKIITPTNIPISMECKLMVCKIESTTPCYPSIESLMIPQTNVYTKSILINSDSGDRLIKLFLWRKA